MTTVPADTLPKTFRTLLDTALRHQPGRPLITAYDEATGARTELSVTTYANWVAKTANLLTEEYFLDEGEVIRLALPVHWLGPVFVGAALLAGLGTTTDAGRPVVLSVSGPAGVENPGSTPTLACSLTPFATPLGNDLPPGADDYGKMWPGQSDVYVGASPLPDSPATLVDGEFVSQAELIATAARHSTAGARILTDANLTEPIHQLLLLGALAAGGSVVSVATPQDADWATRYSAERPTAVVDAGAQPPSR
jgi:uncharacterized protein (TIGR03089 family)